MRQKKQNRFLLLVPAIFLCTACASPLVRYSPINGQDLEGKVKFRFAESIIKFDFAKTAIGLPIEEIIIISSVPITHGDEKYSIAGTGFFENWGVVTTINASFRGDTDLIQQVTVAVTDYRQQAVQSVAGTATALGGPLSIPGKPIPLKLPKGIAITNLLTQPVEGCRNDPSVHIDTRAGGDPAIDPDKAIVCTNMALEGTEDFTADITLGKVPRDAIPASIMDQPMYSANFFYSACRAFTITLKPVNTAKQLPVSTTLAVADPRYLEALRFPDKGSIIVAPSCGAHSVAQDANLPTVIDYLNTLATQAKAIKESFKGASSGVSGTANAASGRGL